MIDDNLKDVTRRIARCCEKTGRRLEDVRLVCVTKEADFSQIEEVIRLGVKDIGENRIQEALSKYKIIGDRVSWHLIGHLQTNKIKDAVRIFSLIHSIDSERVARGIDKEAKKLNKIQDILVQVNCSGEKTKFGLAPDEVIEFINAVRIYQNIAIKGLMTIAPQVDHPEKTRPYFRLLRELRDKVNSLKLTAYSLQLLSMGMSDDFEVAIEEGSDMVRIGRAIFGEKIS